MQKASSLHLSQVSSGLQKHAGRCSITTELDVRMEVAQVSVQQVGKAMGSLHNGPVCVVSNSTSEYFQQLLLGATQHRSQRFGSAGLARPLQLHEQSLFPHSEGSRQDTRHPGRSSRACAQMARSSLVPKGRAHGSGYSDGPSARVLRGPVQSGPSRAMEESPLGFTGLESVWKEKLTRLGWSQSCASQYLLQWAPSTLRSYDCVICQFVSFLSSLGICVISVHEHHIVQFLQSVAAQSERPRSVLSVATAALGHYFHGMGIKNPISERMHEFVGALVKSETSQPLLHSKILSVSAFRHLFAAWEGDPLDMERLRLRAVTLMALVLLLRPSDIAPWSVRCVQGTVQENVFCLKQVRESDDGSLTVNLFGTKNDYLQDGQEVTLPRAQNDLVMCPVRAFWAYQQAVDTVWPRTLV